MTPPGARILVVDDDPDVRRSLRLVLETAGYSVAEARNGADALRSHHAAAADVVVTDLFMPDTDGFELIRELRAHFPVVKIVAVSGGAPRMKQDYLEAARLTGVDAALRKPVEVDELLKTLRALGL